VRDVRGQVETIEIRERTWKRGRRRKREEKQF